MRIHEIAPQGMTHGKHGRTPVVRFHPYRSAMAMDGNQPLSTLRWAHISCSASRHLCVLIRSPAILWEFCLTGNEMSGRHPRFRFHLPWYSRTYRASDRTQSLDLKVILGY
jgi:hypothetical protein